MVENLSVSCCGNTKLLVDIMKTIFHLVGCALFWFVTCYGLQIMCVNFYHENDVLRFLSQFSLAFGTNWNLGFQTVFLSLALMCDVLEWLDKHDSAVGKKLQYLRDVIFSGLVVPFTLFISAMFWSIYTIDRELVFPTVYDQIVPWWFNHCVHTNITVVLVVETILHARRYPCDKRVELAMVAIVGILYAIVYYAIYFLTGRWLYGVFGVMSWWQVCLYQLAIWTSTFVFYYLQFPVNRIFHREESGEEQKTAVDPQENDGTIPTKSWSLKYRTARNENSNL